MSHLFQLISRLEKSGVRLELVDDRLKINVLDGGDLSDDLLQVVKERKEEIVRFLREQKGFEVLPIVEKREYYPLSSAQKRMVVLQQMEPESTSYNISSVLQLEGKLLPGNFRDTFSGLINRHESLRTSFFLVDDEPVQRVLDRVAFELEVFGADGQGGRGGQSGQELIELIVRDFIRPFDLAVAPLLRVGLVQSAEDKHLLMLDMHHIISDGTSMGILAREFMARYGGQALPPLKLQYKDYAAWQQQRREGGKIDQQEKYWLAEFSGEIPVLQLPYDYARPAIQAFEGQAIDFQVGITQTAALKNLAGGAGATLYMVLLSVFSVLLARLSGQEDIVVGAPTAGRLHADLEGIIGMFVNTLATRSQPLDDKSFLDYLAEVKQKTLSAFENQEYPFEELVDRVDVRRDMGRNPLFDVVFVLQNMDLPRLEVAGLVLSPFPNETRTAKFDLSLTAIEAGEMILGNLAYCTRLFKPGTVSRFIGYFLQVIAGVIAGPGIKIGDIDILSEKERERLLEEFSHGTGQPYPGDKTVVELFDEQVVKTPDRTALSGETVGANNYSPLHYSFSYSELNRRTAALAGELIEKGVCPNTIVAIRLERSIEMMIGILGILKAGGAYLPIDPEAPPERVDYMLQDSGAEIVIGPQTVGANCCSPIQDIGAECKGERQFAPTDLAYVIYTSGSTGRPKGVMISHQNLCPLLHWGYEHLALTPDDRTIQNLSYFFDWSAWEIFITLTSGASLHLVNREIPLNPRAMVQFIQSHEITVLHCTPSQFQYLLNESLSANSLKHLCLGAEKLDVDLLKRGLAAVTPGCRVYNMYGPTEATIMAAVLEIDRQGVGTYEHLTSVPIGRFVGNTALWVLDRTQKLCPVKVAGELYVGGQGLARGYLNNPELTAERFVFSPLTPNPSPTGGRGEVAERGAAAIPGTGMLNRIAESPQFVKPQAKLSTVLAGSEGDWCVSPAPHRTPATTHQSPLTNRLYRTGDVARWLEDGSIEFLGRVDFQVKIRGYRIELGEIEAQILKHPAIKEAVVVARDADNREKYLCAYLVAPTHQPLETQVLREFLSQSLPGPMIPAQFVWLEQMPLNPNGKVDRKALPGPQITAGGAGAVPRDEIERRLIGLFSEVLKRPPAAGKLSRIGIDDDFFALGGHSLKAASLVTKIHRYLGVKLSLADIFRAPTVRQLAGSMRDLKPEVFTPITAGEKKAYYEASSAQEQVWVLSQVEASSLSFNVSTLFPWPGDLDRDILVRAFNFLAKRHESLRTVFFRQGGDIKQKVIDAGGTAFIPGYVDMRGILTGPAREMRLAELLAEELQISFNLEKGPLWRVRLLHLAQGNYLFLFTIHHIVADFLSLEVISRELPAIYRSLENGQLPGLPPLAIQYRDYTAWQEERLTGQFSDRLYRYWQGQLSGRLPLLDLPYDRERQKNPAYAGESMTIVIPAEVVGALRALADRHGISLFMALLAAVYGLFFHYSGQTDIIIGTPVSGREHADCEGQVGFFLNMLPLRLVFSAGHSFTALLGLVREMTLAAYEHQAYPFDRLVADLGIARNPGRSPLFDVVVDMLNLMGATAQAVLPDFQFIRPAWSKYDLSIIFAEGEETLDVHFEYRTGLFNRGTIQRLMNRYRTLLQGVVKDPEQSISRLPVQEEKDVGIPAFTTFSRPGSQTGGT